MKISPIILAAVLAAFPVFLGAAQAGGSATESAKPAAKREKLTIQLRVDVPAMMRPWVSDRVAEAFASRVTDALDRQGYKGGVVYLDRFDDPDPGKALLDIHLVEWRTDHVGNVNCTFAASIKSPKGKKELGIFTGTSMSLEFPRRDWFARSESFDEAALQALRDLYKRIGETKLLVS